MIENFKKHLWVSCIATIYAAWAFVFPFSLLINAINNEWSGYALAGGFALWVFVMAFLVSLIIK